MFTNGLWVKFNAVAPDELFGTIGRITVNPNTNDVRFHNKGYLGYWVTYNTYKGFELHGVKATWLTPCEPPEGEALEPWLIREMKR